MSIPAAYRSELQPRSDQPPILTTAEGYLRLHPFEEWCAYEAKIVKLADVDPTARDYARIVLSGAAEAPVDRQGRVLVPQYLREHAGLEREVTLAGCGDTVEIWDSARFIEHNNRTQQDFREISRQIAEKLGS